MVFCENLRAFNTSYELLVVEIELKKKLFNFEKERTKNFEFETSRISNGSNHYYINKDMPLFFGAHFNMIKENKIEVTWPHADVINISKCNLTVIRPGSFKGISSYFFCFF